jgi:DNA-directed RNA polymerase specialized sigma24 family protein
MTSTGEQSGNGGGKQPAEERAEELMQRVTADVSRFLTRFAGRAREEFEDIVAEARTVRDGWGGPKAR